MLRRQLTYANVMSTLAVFLVLAGGGAYAASKLKTNSVKSKHIAPDAVQGVDAKESTFGPVPRANQADKAGDAATVGGIPVEGLQFGDGVDDATAGVIDSNQTGSFVTVGSGTIMIHCSASPTLSVWPLPYGPDNIYPIHVWIDGTHTLLPGVPASVDNVPLSADDTVQIQTWGRNGVVGHIVASVSWDAANTECASAFTSQENLDTGLYRGTTAREFREAWERNRQEGLPDGWVTPSGRP